MNKTFADNHNGFENKKIKNDSILEQDIINYITVPSLESIAIIKVGTGLCKQSDIINAIQQHSVKTDFFWCNNGCNECNFECIQYNKNFIKLENSILDKVSHLPLPNLLKAKVAYVIRPVLLQTFDLIRHDPNDIEYLDYVYWTSEGTIDKVKTFLQLAYKDSIKDTHPIKDIHNLFKFACAYCLKDIILYLRGKLPEEAQKPERDYADYERLFDDDFMMAYWFRTVYYKLPEINHEEHYRSNGVYKNMLTLAVTEGSISAIKYFWNKLTKEEITSNLVQWIYLSINKRKTFGMDWPWLDKRVRLYQNINKYSNVLYFLLSQMVDAEQQREIIQVNSAVILKSLFLDWPWQRFLLPTIQTIWSSLDKNVYLELLATVGQEIKTGKTTEKLFRELWQKSPQNLKKCFIPYIMKERWFGIDVLFNLLAVEDMGTIKLILDYVNVEEKKQVIFSVVKNAGFFTVLYADKFSVFDTFISETLSSESDIHNLKTEIILRHGNRLCCDWICNDNYQMVEKFFNWAFTSQDQTDKFKNKILAKNEIAWRIIIHIDNYELADKFINWCFSNE